MRCIALLKRRALGSRFSRSAIGAHFCSGRTRLPSSDLNTAKAPFWAAVVAFLGFAWNCYRDYEDWRLLTLFKNRSEKELEMLDI